MMINTFPVVLWKRTGHLYHQAIQAAARHDLGVFIISPSDKGGMLYKPSTKLDDACEPFGPICFNNMWLWTHDPPLHTLEVGAARPSDLDEHLAGQSTFLKAQKLV